MEAGAVTQEVGLRDINLDVIHTEMKIPPRQVAVLPRKCLERKGPREEPWETLFVEQVGKESRERRLAM